ncbi:GNAT family N-acetyltransferase [Paenibacillus sp. KN14-4R]|uniref:GNAT family N-acetyltransferase n=1 Tax=Paenibacillus sp. KN14-4R TaxID=3445773 RepID=UPI003FA1732F
MNITVRRADMNDLEIIVEIDLLNEGYTSNDSKLTPDEVIEHSKKIYGFIVDEDKGILIVEDQDRGTRIGYIMYRISNRDKPYPWKTAFSELDRNLFQEDGRFLEIFNLWVDSKYRRQGLATLLKKFIECEAKSYGVNLIYTHTEEENGHVIELNRKLGYQEVRRGTIWDQVVRVSLIKQV